MIPENFEQWLHCITVDCKIQLTKDFISSRIKELKDSKHPHTVQIIKIYGQEHYQNLLNWFSQAASIPIQS
jgi:hypothetical protein